MQSLAPAILALIFAAVVLVFGLIITDNLMLSQSNTQHTVINQSLTSVTSNSSVNSSGFCGFNSFTITSIYNATGDVLLSTGNYSSENSRTGVVLYTGVGTLYDETWNISYTFEAADDETVCSAANNTIGGLSNFSDFWAIIVLAVVIAIVIGLLLLVFGGRRER